MRMNVASRAVAFLLAFGVMIASPTAHAGSSSEYVQDGLLACWDGFENAGVDTHDVFDSQDWKTLKSGVYGSSESGAEFVRDDLFSGSGTLTVARSPFMLILR